MLKGLDRSVENPYSNPDILYEQHIDPYTCPTTYYICSFKVKFIHGQSQLFDILDITKNHTHIRWTSWEQLALEQYSHRLYLRYVSIRKLQLWANVLTNVATTFFSIVCGAIYQSLLLKTSSLIHQMLAPFMLLHHSAVRE